MREVIRTRWRSALLDGVAVLMGILIAFGIDPWRDMRSERARERAYLEALRSELSHARAAIQENKATLEQEFQRSGVTATVLSAPSSASISSDSIRAVIHFGPTRLFTPPRAALDDLIHSGGLVLIRSDSARRALASYEQALARDFHEQERLTDIWMSHLGPYRYQHGSMQKLADSFGVATVSPEINRAAYVGNRHYINLILARMIRIRDVTTAHDSLTTHINRLLPLLKDD